MFNNRLWLNGIKPYSNEYHVWETADGTSWSMVNTSTPNLAGRLVVFQNKLWIIGCSSVYSLGNEIWQSPDGHHWTKVRSSVPWYVADHVKDYVKDCMVTSLPSGLLHITPLWGHEVETAHDGPAAVEAARRFQPEVVLLDISLPGMNGHEVAHRLRLALSNYSLFCEKNLDERP